MSAYRIASRYAQSLLDLAKDTHKLDRIKEDVESFSEVVKNRDFYLMLKSPIVNASKKKAIIKQLFEGKYDELTISFLNILVDKGREEFLPEIAAEFNEQYKKEMHISTVKITSAAPLGDEVMADIRKRLLESNVTDDKLDIHTSIDPSLIGGFILEVNDRVYDTTVSHKLKSLKREFKDNIYLSQIIAH